MDNNLIWVTQKTGSSIESAINASSFHGGQYASDIFLRLLCNSRDLKGTYSPSTATTNLSSWRTVLSADKTFFQGLDLLTDILNEDAPSASSPSNWRPRQRVSLCGLIFDPATMVSSTVGSVFTYSSSVLNGLTFNALNHPTQGTFITLPRIVALAKKVVEKMGSSFTVVRLYGTTGRHTVRYTFHKVTDSVVSYSIHLLGESNYITQPGRGGVLDYDMILFGHHDVSDVLQGHVKNVHLYNMVNWVQGSEVSQTNPGLMLAKLDLDYRVDYSTLQSTVLANRVSINACKPALYHTQSKAISGILSNLSRNFESLVESPELFSLLASLPGDIAIFSKLSELPWVGRVFAIVKLLLSAHLAYIFAIRPAMKSAFDVIQSFKRESVALSGEGFMRFNSDVLTIDDLPRGLRALLDSIRPVGVVSFDIWFHTQMQRFLSDDDIASTVSSAFGVATQLGIVPEPRYLWAGLTLSFVVDWFLPISTLIGDLQNRFHSIGFTNRRIGHTVCFSVVYLDGSVFHFYVRSDSTSVLIDPVGDSWLLPSGVFVSAAVPLIILRLI